MMVNIWSTIGTMMLIFLAALQDIPVALYEAAQIDGANRLQILRYVTIPALRPAIFFVVTMGVIGCFQVSGPSGAPTSRWDGPPPSPSSCR
jgi:carbohydrate ABC transporter membrane protein